MKRYCPTSQLDGAQRPNEHLFKSCAEQIFQPGFDLSGVGVSFLGTHPRESLHDLIAINDREDHSTGGDADIAESCFHVKM
jgi:hypothetical protein